MKKRDSLLSLDESLASPKKLNNKSGFTIVELLVVIVVIGILAAITVVSYSGISQRATVASLQSDLDNNSKKLKMYYTLYDSYPTALDANNCPTAPRPDSNYCLSASTSTTYQYTGSSSAFCVTATKSSNSYYINQDAIPTAGSCSITNLIINPSFEVTTNWTSTGGDYLVHNTNAKSKYGTYSGIRTVNHAWGQWGEYFQHDYVVTPGTTYTLSGWSLIDVGAVSVSTVLTVVQSDWTGIAQDNPHDSIGSWTRYSVTWTQPVGQTIARVILGAWGDNTSVGTWYWDGIILTQGSTSYSYADGSSSGWTWNGAANSSTSTGLPL
ncbi:prepilin-type N-terminal cleavage/methylation domain-containing protein [Candidatus Saccharibacteria bacterium]|nr:prepilin-type N-terminal cleavage/methylation domain-containing protein [Candidatus Saccharibacteria bacterium]